MRDLDPKLGLHLGPALAVTIPHEQRLRALNVLEFIYEEPSIQCVLSAYVARGDIFLVLGNQTIFGILLQFILLLIKI